MIVIAARDDNEQLVSSLSPLSLYSVITTYCMNVIRLIRVITITIIIIIIIMSSIKLLAFNDVVEFRYDTYDL